MDKFNKEQVERIIHDLIDMKTYNENKIYAIRQTYRDVDPFVVVPILEDVCKRIEYSNNSIDIIIKTLKAIE